MSRPEDRIGSFKAGSGEVQYVEEGLKLTIVETLQSEEQKR